MRAKTSLRFFIFLWVFLSIIAFSGCGPAANNSGNPTPTPSSISTPVPTSTSTPTPTPKTSSTPTPSPTPMPTPILDPHKINAAVFEDLGGGSTAGSCVSNTVTILTNYGCNVIKASPTAIKSPGWLNGFDIVLFPGGSGSGEARAIGQTGCNNVAAFVNAGGGYIGTCAGGYLAAEGYNVAGSDTSASFWLVLVNAQILDPNHWGRGEGTAHVTITNTTHPITNGFSGTINAGYYNGPIFGPGSTAGLPAYTELAEYADNSMDNSPTPVMSGNSALIVSTYGSGKCVLFSFHPELTTGLESMLTQAVNWAKRARTY